MQDFLHPQYVYPVVDCVESGHIFEVGMGHVKFSEVTNVTHVLCQGPWDLTADELHLAAELLSFWFQLDCEVATLATVATA